MDTIPRAKKYDSDDILSPVEVLELMPPSIKTGWLYSNWSELGGVTIGNKKLIKYGVLHANLEGKQRQVLHKVEGTGARKQEIPEASGCWNESKELGYEERSTSCRAGVEEIGGGEVHTDIEEDDPFDLASAL